MTEERSNFREQAVNRFIEFVLSRLVDAECLRVRIKCNLKQLRRGELDGLSIQMSNLLLRPYLRVAEFQLDIGAAAVNMKSIIRRKIELLHPSEGKLLMAIDREQLTEVLNAELTDSLKEKQQRVQLEKVNCELTEEGAIAFHFHWIFAGKIQSGTYITLPEIEANGQGIFLNKQSFVGAEVPGEFLDLAIAKVNNILSLNDIAQRGTKFDIQQIEIAAGKLTIQANANIEQFPSA
ncbi:DUF2993 domain-containing protein [Aerosakkonemataceae cyanobacterium BLCC-F154]|uniref:DUF2993 domain-containing protein n=1 Tax=Floridaenema fluviatile BLCC-F154 TaxID=3153640 RepID=A0ABV4YBE9_9CYAN